MFQRFRSEGRRFRHGIVWCTVVDDPAATPPRVAYAVGRPVGGAVVRNRVRRRLRAVMAEEARAGGLPPGYYLVGVRPDAGQATFAAIGADVRDTVRQIHEARRG